MSANRFTTPSVSTNLKADTADSALRDPGVLIWEWLSVSPLRLAETPAGRRGTTNDEQKEGAEQDRPVGARLVSRRPESLFHQDRPLRCCQGNGHHDQQRHGRQARG
jgi:hypothetical protein